MALYWQVPLVECSAHGSCGPPIFVCASPGEVTSPGRLATLLNSRGENRGDGGSGGGGGGGGDGGDSGTGIDGSRRYMLCCCGLL